MPIELKLLNLSLPLSIMLNKTLSLPAKRDNAYAKALVNKTFSLILKSFKNDLNNLRSKFKSSLNVPGPSANTLSNKTPTSSLSINIES